MYSSHYNNCCNYIGSISVLDRQPEYLMFTWNANVPANTVRYNIFSSNCGLCPDHTTNTTITCINPPMDGSLCTLTLQTALCMKYIEVKNITFKLLRGKSVT